MYRIFGLDNPATDHRSDFISRLRSTGRLPPIARQEEHGRKFYQLEPHSLARRRLTPSVRHHLFCGDRN